MCQRAGGPPGAHYPAVSCVRVCGEKQVRDISVKTGGLHVFRFGFLAVPESICLIKNYCEVVFLNKICVKQNV